MDPLFWILAGVVSVCVIGIIVLWLLERQATRRLAEEQAEDSARLKAIDPREALEEIDTHPIPATPPAAPGARRQQPPAPLGPAYTTPDTPFPGSQQAGYQHEFAANGNGNYPQPPVVSRPLPPRQEATQPAEIDLEQFSTGPLEPLPQPPVVVAPAAEEPPPAPAPAAPAAEAVHAAAAPQEQLQTTPERASLRAAELARERLSLEQMLEENLARLDLLQRSAGMADPDNASSASQLQSEITRQRERLQELTFLEQSYRQVAAGLSEQLAQHHRSASPDTPRAFGVRRHSLARVDQSGQRQRAPNHQPESEP